MSVCVSVTVFACLCECIGVNVCLCVCLHVMCGYVCDMHTYKNLKIKASAGWCKAQGMETSKREAPLDEKQLMW